MARWRISSSATTVTACWRISRSKSPSTPASRAATSHACGAPRPRRDTGSTSERPASSGWSGANSAVSPARPFGLESSSPRRITSARTCSSAASGISRRNERAEIVSPRPDEHVDRAAGGRRQRAHQLVEPALLEHEPLEPLVDRDAALQDLVLLVHEARERLLGDRDERQLVGHLEHREAQPARLLHERGRQLGVLEPGPEAEPGEVAARKQPHELALALGAVELDARRQQKLPARQPGRRVEEL